MSQPKQQNPWRVPLLALGGDFMTGDEIGVQAKSLGIPKGGLYFRGRVGALGELTSAAAHDVLAIFPESLIDKTWTSSSAIPTSATVEAYTAACHDWGRHRLADLAAGGRLAKLLNRAVDGVDPVGAHLAQGWRRAARPADTPASVAHAAMVLREVRGGLHFAALALVNLPVTRAIVADDLGGVARMRRTGWSREAADEVAASAQPGDAERWREAEAATEAAFIGALAEVLGEDGVNELGGLVLEAYEASRAP